MAGVQQSNVNAGRPLLQSVALESAVLPKRVRSWSVQVEVSNDMQLRGGGKMKDGYLRQRNFLFEAPAKEITFYDRDGQTYLAKIQDIQSVGTRRVRSTSPIHCTTGRIRPTYFVICSRRRICHNH